MPKFLAKNVPPWAELGVLVLRVHHGWDADCLSEELRLWEVPSWKPNRASSVLRHSLEKAFVMLITWTNVTWTTLEELLSTEGGIFGFREGVPQY